MVTEPSVIPEYSRFVVMPWQMPYTTVAMGSVSTVLNLPPVTVSVCIGCGAVVFDKIKHTEHTCYGLSQVLADKGGTWP